MRVDDKKNSVHLGFLTTFGSSHHGVIGGFLVLNLTGRPVEFHCTSPVRPNKAQEILYGDALESFICGEQIAPALVGRTQNELAAVLTNDPNMLPATTLLQVPVGIVLRHILESNLESGGVEPRAIHSETHNVINSNATTSVRSSSTSMKSNVSKSDDDKTNDSLFFYESLDKLPFVPGVDYSQWRETILGKNRLAFPVNTVSESLEKTTFDECVSRLLPFLKSIDPVEPFERIRLAIKEAQKSN